VADLAHYAIIGAGIAGLSALQVLSAAGHQATVFDKSRGSGGRMATKKLAADSWDMGAQFFHAHSNEFATQLSQWQQQGVIAEWPVTPWVINGTRQHPSADDQKRYVAIPRMTALSRLLLQNATHFEANTRITGCEETAQGWQVTASEGEIFGPYDGLVVAIPPAQAAALASNDPALAVTSETSMLPCWTLLLSFDTPLPAPYDAAFVKSGPLAWVSRNNSKPGREATEAWVIQASHLWSLQHQDTPRHEIQKPLLAAFAEALRLPAVPQWRHLWLHRWLYALPEKKMNQGFQLNAQQTLAICGDWLHSPNIEGAWLSGRTAANALL
tara:strand:- start:228 stop:1208 length:981 start_codon:yes stop_codon:yes gene_type:complete